MPNFACCFTQREQSKKKVSGSLVFSLQNRNLILFSTFLLYYYSYYQHKTPKKTMYNRQPDNQTISFNRHAARKPKKRKRYLDRMQQRVYDHSLRFASNFDSGNLTSVTPLDEEVKSDLEFEPELDFRRR